VPKCIFYSSFFVECLFSNFGAAGGTVQHGNQAGTDPPVPMFIQCSVVVWRCPARLGSSGWLKSRLPLRRPGRPPRHMFIKQHLPRKLLIKWPCVLVEHWCLQTCVCLAWVCVRGARPHAAKGEARVGRGGIRHALHVLLSCASCRLCMQHFDDCLVCRGQVGGTCTWEHMEAEWRAKKEASLVAVVVSSCSLVIVLCMHPWFRVRTRPQIVLGAASGTIQPYIQL
jgi:hypothetical protein